MSRLSQILPIFYFLIDVLILVFAFLASGQFLDEDNYHHSKEYSLAIAITLWAGIGYSRNLYKSNLHNGFPLRMISYSKTYLIFAVALIVITFIVFEFPAQVYKSLLSFVIVFLGMDITINTFVINAISLWRRRSENIKSTLVIGVGDQAARISSYFESNPDFGFRVRGYLKENGEETKVPQGKVLGPLRNLRRFLKQNPIEEIVIALPYKLATRKVKHIIEQADLYGIRVSFLPDYHSMFGKHCKIIHDREFEAVHVRQLPLDEFYPLIEKTIFDFVFSFGVLIMLSPLFVVISILIKLDSPGPVFYCPMRVGRGGKNFKVYKFRTMFENDPVQGGKRSTQAGDPRITRVGKIMRKYNIDELPQFWNVFAGDMSVVGPRPHRNFLSEQMKEHYDKYMVRHYFKPGITGWAQVNGWRGPTETEMQIIMRTAHDLWYIENWSFMLDMKIIWQTIFSRKAYQNAF